MDSVLVTGGAGFIGSHLARFLLEKGNHVVIVDDLSGGFRCNIPDGVEFVQFSLNDTRAVQALFQTHDVRYVYHLAAYAAEGLSHYVRHFNYSINLLASTNLINASVVHGVECFVYLSSIAVYGEGQPPFKETDHPSPIDPYGIAKYAVECDLRAAAAMFGLPFVVFRPHNVYGERQNLSDPFRNVVGIFLRRLLEGKPCPVYGSGEQTRAFSYVGDIVPVLAGSVRIKQAQGEVFNIGSDRPCTIINLATLLSRIVGVDTGIEHLPERQEVFEAHCRHDKARDLLGFRECTSLEAGLRRMTEWARGITIAPHRPHPDIEIEKGLYAPWADRRQTAKNTNKR